MLQSYVETKTGGLVYVQFFFAILGATACSAITTAIQTSAGLAGYPRRGLNPHLPLELGSKARGRCNVNRCGWGRLNHSTTQAAHIRTPSHTRGKDPTHVSLC